jgi:hypothetical protein
MKRIQDQNINSLRARECHGSSSSNAPPPLPTTPLSIKIKTLDIFIFDIGGFLKLKNYLFLFFKIYFSHHHIKISKYTKKY